MIASRRGLCVAAVLFGLAPQVATAETVEQAGGENGPILLIAYVLLALCVSFVCSIAESVLLCITPSYIESIQADRPKLARLLTKLRIRKVDESFAAILSLNTVAHTVGAIMAGVQAKVVFGASWVGLFSAGMTLMILFLSEIVPKTLGAVYWKQLVGATAFVIQGMVYSSYPVVWLSEKLTKRIGRGRVAHLFSRDEIIAMAEAGSREGCVEQHESRIFKNLFEFTNLVVTDIMTPRVVISALPGSMRIAEALSATENEPFSRIPVYNQDIDDVSGFVLKDQILILAAQNKTEATLETIKRDIPLVPETLSLPRLLENMLKLRQYIAVVVDEYGGTAGLVTMEDVVETLLGIEITDEMDSSADMRHLAREQWKKRAKKLGINL